MGLEGTIRLVMEDMGFPEAMIRALALYPLLGAPGGASSQERREPCSGGDKEVEDLRKRVLREAEETFEREVMRLQAARAGDDVSYKTASDGGATGGPVPPRPGGTLFTDGPLLTDLLHRRLHRLQDQLKEEVKLRQPSDCRRP